jgi:hypothetical protein
MKLRFRAMLKVAHWPAWDKHSDFTININDIQLNFKLSERVEVEAKHFLKLPVEVDIPIKDEQIIKEKLPQDASNGRYFMLNPYEDKNGLPGAYMLAAYTADILQNQASYCELLEVTPIAYIPETDKDKKLLENSLIKQEREAAFVSRVGDINIDSIQRSFQRYWQHREFLHIKSHAMRLKDPISKYRELYRTLEYAQKHLPKVKLQKADKKARFNKSDLVLAKHTGLKPEEFKNLRLLRDQCSHAAENFITHGDLEEIKKIEEAMPMLKKAVDILEKKLLSQP